MRNGKKKILKNYGFVPPIITSGNHMLGGLGTLDKKILNPERDWFPFLPIGELQKQNIETQNCVSFGTLNCLEILSSRLSLDESNYSDRALGIMANTDPFAGNDPHTVAETIRKKGLVKEQSLPFESFTNPEDYYKPKPLPGNLVDEAKSWLERFDFRHQWVFHNNLSLEKKQEKLLEALQYSPVGVSVTAWKEKNGLYVKDEGDQDNHWCVLVAGEEGKSWQVMDSYSDGDFIKELAWDYNFSFAKLYVLDRIEKKSLWSRLAKWFDCQ